MLRSSMRSAYSSLQGNGEMGVTGATKRSTSLKARSKRRAMRVCSKCAQARSPRVRRGRSPRWRVRWGRATPGYCGRCRRRRLQNSLPAARRSSGDRRSGSVLPARRPGCGTQAPPRAGGSCVGCPGPPLRCRSLPPCRCEGPKGPPPAAASPGRRRTRSASPWCGGRCWSRACAVSATVRAMGPSTETTDQPNWRASLTTTPGDGRRPITPHSAASMRSEPSVSEPVHRGSMCVSSAAADPPDDPPALSSGLKGYRWCQPPS
jgi:hypothetical protein